MSVLIIKKFTIIGHFNFSLYKYMSIEILTEVKIKFEEVFKNDRKEQLF